MSLNGYAWVEGNTPNAVDPSGMIAAPLPVAAPLIPTLVGLCAANPIACAVVVGGIGAALFIAWWLNQGAQMCATAIGDIGPNPFPPPAPAVPRPIPLPGPISLPIDSPNDDAFPIDRVIPIPIDRVRDRERPEDPCDSHLPRSSRAVLYAGISRTIHLAFKAIVEHTIMERGDGRVRDFDREFRAVFAYTRVRNASGICVSRAAVSEFFGFMTQWGDSAAAAMGSSPDVQEYVDAFDTGHAELKLFEAARAITQSPITMGISHPAGPCPACQNTLSGTNTMVGWIDRSNAPLYKTL
jgi:hypothetical protein